MTNSSDPLMPFVLALLTPLLLTAGITDIALAQRAATETIAAYKATSRDQLITAAQIVAFALASLDNLRLSAAPEQSVSTTVRLRSNANALNRATQRSTDALEHQRRDAGDAAGQQAALASLEQPQTAIEPPQAPAEPSASRPQTWATAMTDVAAECARNLTKLPPEQRQAEIIRIGALREAASHIASGVTLNKATLLTTTSLTTR